MVEFVSYTGRYPNLCSGILTLKINGINVTLPQLCMNSGGSVSFDEEWNESVTQGAWSVTVPDDLKDFQEEINTVVNANVPYGCCGGCV